MSSARPRARDFTSPSHPRALFRQVDGSALLTSLETTYIARPTNAKGREVHGFQGYRIKIDISCFDGHLYIEKFMDWVEGVILFIYYYFLMEIPEEKQVK